jgi:predicted transcriptional regulator
MPARKRSKLEREEGLVCIARMHAKGKLQREIAQALGLTQQQISHDLKRDLPAMGRGRQGETEGRQGQDARQDRVPRIAM